MDKKRKTIEDIEDISLLETFLEESHQLEDGLNTTMGNNCKKIDLLKKENKRIAKKVSNTMLHRNRIINRLNYLRSK